MRWRAVWRGKGCEAMNSHVILLETQAENRRDSDVCTCLSKDSIIASFCLICARRYSRLLGGRKSGCKSEVYETREGGRVEGGEDIDSSETGEEDLVVTIFEVQ